MDPLKAEFSCPTCRRLANVLLPDVDASLSSRKLDLHEDGKDVEQTGEFWSKFWQSNKNLEYAVENFCCQVCYQLLDDVRQEVTLNCHVAKCGGTS